MKFQQETYKDDNGHSIDAKKIHGLSSIEFVVDGFYRWWCSNCDFEYSSRSCGWAVAGQVLKCENCSRYSLLVSTDCDRIFELRQENFKSQERDQELERLKDIEKYNEGQLWVIKQVIYNKVNAAIASALKELK